MAATSERASNAPMPKPPCLVEANGWNRRLRMKSPSIPPPLSVMAMATSSAAPLTRTVTGSTPGWPRAHSAADGRPPARARRASAIAHSVGVAEQLERRARRAWRRSRRRGSGAAAAARPSWTRACACGAKPGEQVVHLADRALERRDHVGAEFGIVGVALGIARDQRQLADQVLDVVEDEGEAAVEFLEPLRVGERLLAMRFGERARRLAAGGAQQVEILPVERAAIVGRGEQDEADQPVDDGSAGRRPRRARRSSSHCGHRQLAVARARPSRWRSASNSRIRAVAPRPRARRRDGLGQVVGRGPAPGQFHVAAVAIGARRRRTSSRPPGASTMSAKALTTRSPSGGASAPARPRVSVKRSHSVR